MARRVTVNSVTVASDVELTVSVTVAANATVGSRELLLANTGTGPGPDATVWGGCGSCLKVT
jgi:hypothetical protein